MPYSPITMLLCWPLASLSYVHGFFAWIGLGLALCIWSLSWLTGWELAVFASIGTPAAFINILLGQTGYYTAALLAWGLMLVVRRPLPAGILLAMLCCKPQLGILVAVALAAGGHWRVLAVTAATLIGLAAASAIVLGPHTWIDFFNRLVPQRHFMESRVPAWSWMPTVFAMMRLLGTGLPGAYLIQGVSAISAALSVAALWRGQCPHGLKCAGLVIATFLATPYAWDYDAVVLMFSAAWLANEGIRTGFASWEKMTVLVLLTLPALSVIPAKLLGFQIAPILLWLALAVVMRRALNQRFPMAISAVRRPSAQSTV
jgi:Glycosyltransferase family 87